MNSPTSRRKLDHLKLCAAGDVEFRCTTTLFSNVRLVHCALPELAADEVDLACEAFGRRLSAPLLIGAMTGGTAPSASINRDLAEAAAALGIGLQLGSQRAMLEDRRLAATYRVRDAVPDLLLMGNIGLAQAREMTDRQVRALLDEVEADALCLHLNCAMELAQPEGERDFRRGLETIRRLDQLLGERLVVKETGCGISSEVGRKLREAGVQWIDIAGAGGTSWVRVEQLRSRGQGAFAEWGIPTAASLCELARLAPAGSQPLRLIASGGVRSGLDLAKALALGATLGAAALPFLRALQAPSPRRKPQAKEGVIACGRRFIAELRAACILTGCRSLADLRRAPTVITGALREWLEQRTAPPPRHGSKHVRQ